MDIDEIKKRFEEKSIDPLLIVMANKGYQWIVKNDLTEEDASKFEQYILKNTTNKELEEIRNKKKSLRDFITWKYINYLEN